MAEKTTKLKVVVELKNGDYYKIKCSSIEYDQYGIELWGTENTNITFKYEDIELMAIHIDDTNELLTFRAIREPKVERED